MGNRSAAEIVSLQGSPQGRLKADQKRNNDRPEEDGTLNSGHLIAPAAEEIHLQPSNDFQPIEWVAIGNAEQLWKFAWFAQQLIFKWLNRRSQRRSYTWTSFSAAWERWKMPSPSIVEKPWSSAGQAPPACYEIPNQQPSNHDRSSSCAHS